MLNNNNFQLKINNFWETVSEMNDIHMELWNNRNDSQLKPEPDADTLEILANIEAIEEAIESQNQIESENQLQIEIEQAKNDIINTITDMIEFITVKDIPMLVKNEMLNPGYLDAYIAEKVQEKTGHIIPQDVSVNDIHYLDDMDEIDRRNIQRQMGARMAI